MQINLQSQQKLQIEMQNNSFANRFAKRVNFRTIHSINTVCRLIYRAFCCAYRILFLTLIPLHRLLLALDHYQSRTSLTLHIKCCTLDDKIVAFTSGSCNYYIHDLNKLLIHYSEQPATMAGMSWCVWCKSVWL